MLYDPPKFGALCAFAAGASKHAPASRPKASNLLLVVAILLFMMLLTYCETPALFGLGVSRPAHAAQSEDGGTKIPDRSEMRSMSISSSPFIGLVQELRAALQLEERRTLNQRRAAISGDEPATANAGLSRKASRRT